MFRNSKEEEVIKWWPGIKLVFYGSQHLDLI